MSLIVSEELLTPSCHGKHSHAVSLGFSCYLVTQITSPFCCHAKYEPSVGERNQRKIGNGKTNRPERMQEIQRTIDMYHTRNPPSLWITPHCYHMVYLILLVISTHASHFHLGTIRWMCNTARLFPTSRQTFLLSVGELSTPLAVTYNSHEVRRHAVNFDAARFISNV